MIIPTRADPAKKMMIWVGRLKGFLRLPFSRANCQGTSPTDAFIDSSGFTSASAPSSDLTTPSWCAPQYKHLSFPAGTSWPHSEHCVVTISCPFPFSIFREPPFFTSNLETLIQQVKRHPVGHSHEDKMKKRLGAIIGENHGKVKYFKGLLERWIVRE